MFVLLRGNEVPPSWKRVREELLAFGGLLALVATVSFGIAFLPDSGSIPQAGRWLSVISTTGAVICFLLARRFR